MSEELWLPVRGYEGLYIVSNAGRVSSVPRMVRCRWGQRQVRGKACATYVDRAGHGYRCVGLSKDGIAAKAQVHVLVLEAFIGPRPEGMQACHADGDRTNARLSNLRWDTPKNNQADRLKHGTHLAGERHPRSRMSDELAQWIRESGQSSLALAPVLGLASSTIRAVRLGDNRAAGRPEIA